MSIMTNGFIEQVFNWFTTPEELRSIADKMERQHKNAKPGDSTVVTSINIENNNVHSDVWHTIKISYDQEKMNKV